MRHDRLLAVLLVIAGYSLPCHAVDIQFNSATTSSSKVVELAYTILDDAIPDDTVPLQIFRSSDDALDPETDLLLASATLTEGSVGTHTQQIELDANELAIDAARPFLFVVADLPTSEQPLGVISETDETNNVSTFRKYAVAVIIHGLTFYEGPPDWVGLMSETLLHLGYDATIPADWAGISSEFRAGAPQEFAVELSAQVLDQLAELTLEEHDRIDVHWIAHSRGAVVASEALNIWNEAGDLPEAVTAGWLTLTLLDPHPAKNRSQRLMSVNKASILGELLGLYTFIFQAIARDPDILIPTELVTDAELYYQRAPWFILSPSDVYFDYLTNLWGEGPLAGIPENQTFDITQPRLPHFQVPNYFIDNVLLTE